MKVNIKFSNDNSLYDVIGTNLHSYNRSKCQWIKDHTDAIPTAKKYYNFGVYENDKLIGGAIGFIEYGWYFLEELYIDEHYRGNSIGTKIINEIEKCAKENNAIGVRMETWDFQAKGFYEKMGYKVYATFEDCPPGTTDYFLRKKLD